MGAATPLPPLSEMAEQYASGVEDGTVLAPETVKAAVRRWRQYQERHIYDTKKLDGVGKRLATLPCPEGAFGKMKLMPWQAFTLSWIYSFQDSEGKRVVNDLLVVVPRKAGKSTLMACVGLMEITIPFGGVKSPLVLCCGVNEETCKITFGKAKSIMEMDRGKDFSKAYKMAFTSKAIACKLNNGSVAMLSLGARSLEGYTATGALVDEISQLHDSNGIDTIRSGFGAAYAPLMVMTTTPGDLPRSALDEQLPRALRWLGMKDDNDIDEHDDRYAAVLYMADDGDDPGSPVTWAKSQPSLGSLVTEEWYEGQWRNAKGDARMEHKFKTRQLCMDVKVSGGWVAADEWDSASHDDPWPANKVAGRRYFIGLDLSDINDTSSLCLLEQDVPTGDCKVWWEAYYPRASLPDGAGESTHMATQAMQWVQDGHLKICEGKVINQAMIAEKVNALVKALGPVSILLDPYGAMYDLKSHLSPEAKRKLFTLPKSLPNLTEPTALSESWIKGGKLKVQAHPVARQHLLNAVMYSGRDGGMMLRKEHPNSRHKIDCLDAMVNCIAAVARSQDRTGSVQAPYEQASQDWYSKIPLFLDEGD